MDTEHQKREARNIFVGLAAIAYAVAAYDYAFGSSHPHRGALGAVVKAMTQIAGEHAFSMLSFCFGTFLLILAFTNRSK